MKNIKKYNLILIFIFGISLRLYRVNGYPPLLWDEAGLGYNAYSILKTGRDEYGNTLPLIFKSFGDYKPGLYVYLTIPFVGLLGLTELAVRLPSVILGSLTSVVVYFLVKEISKDEKLSLISAVVLALLPWHIHFSRGAWEANVMTFFITLATYFIVKWLNCRIAKWFNVGLLMFLLALITYQGGKLVVPLIGLGLAYLTARSLPDFKKFLTSKFLVPGSLFIVLVAAWYLVSFTGSARNRLKVMSLFSYRRPESEINQILTEDGLERRSLHYFLFHGEWLRFLRGGLSRYFNHFSPRFLGFEGDWQNARHSAPYFGVIGHLGLILLILGLIKFAKDNKNWSNNFFLYWLAVSPIPAALTRDSVSSVRALTMTIPLSFFISWGVKWLLEIRNDWFKVASCAFFILIFIFNFLFYLDLYHNHMVKLHPKQWLYGYRQATQFVNDNQEAFDQVIMTDFYGQPYIYYLFYSQYPPKKFQDQAELITGNQADVGRIKQIDNVTFEPINWQVDSVKENTLIILSQDEVLRNELDKKPIMRELKPIGRINNQSMFYGFSTKSVSSNK